MGGAGRVRGAALLALAVLLASSAEGRAAPGKGDPLRPLQWGLDQVHADAAWRTTTGKGVVVAVVDSGVDLAHPDLKGQLVPGHDWTGSGSVQDDCGHGTEVTGVLVARRGNGQGVAGIAPDAKVMPLKQGGGCSESLTDIASAITYAADHGARVVSISVTTIPVVGDAGFVAFLQQQFDAAVAHAWAKGTLVVAAAGNSSSPICGYPAALAHVLCVGAVGQDGTKAYYSHSEVRPGVDLLVAPGGGNLPLQNNIWTTTAGSSGTAVGVGGTTAPGYDSVAGTSFATPFVAGVAALLFSRGLGVQEVHDRLLRTATDLGVPGKDPVYGWGEVDAAAALWG